MVHVLGPIGLLEVHTPRKKYQVYRFDLGMPQKKNTTQRYRALDFTIDFLPLCQFMLSCSGTIVFTLYALAGAFTFCFLSLLYPA